MIAWVIVKKLAWQATKKYFMHKAWQAAVAAYKRRKERK